MTYKKKLFLLVNALLLSAALLTGLYAHRAAGLLFARDVIYIAPMLHESHLFFSQADFENARDAFSHYTFAPEIRGSRTLSATGQQVTATVMFTTSDYFSMFFADFVTGNYWLSQDEADTIVLGCALAWRLFGSFNVAGLPVEAEGRYYTVSGVIRQGRDASYMAWMSRHHAPASAQITALYLRAYDFNPLNAVVDVENLLRMHLLRNVSDYARVDINRYVESIHMRNRILFYLLWFAVLVILLCNLAGALKAKKWEWAGILLVGVGVGAFFLFGVNDILQWMPNPALTDSSAFADFTNIGALPPAGYLTYAKLQLRQLNMLANGAWIVGAITALVLLITGKWVRL